MHGLVPLPPLLLLLTLCPLLLLQLKGSKCPPPPPFLLVVPPAGTSYMDVIKLLHLPTQLAEVDPIVASFCGGSVGVLTALLIVEANNAKMQVWAVRL